MRVRFDIAYDGTAYAGWQIQPNGTAIQACLEDALERVSGCRPKLHGSGRTDQGVHARGQVAHADLDTAVEPARLRRALNAVLPADIRVLAVGRAADDFHARKSAIGKEYRYFIHNGPVMPPHRRFYALHVPRRLDDTAMRAAAALLVGRHDFAAFSANPNRHVETTVRRLDRLDVRRNGCELVVIAAGEGFLYKMVRSLAGFLLRVGEGAVPPGEAADILRSQTRTARVPTAPPQGLFLWRVRY